MQMGGDLGQVYRRLVSAVNDIEKRIPFSHDDRLGFLTFCPTNLGTTVRASVHIKVPKLAADLKKLEEVAGKYNLQVIIRKLSLFICGSNILQMVDISWECNSKVLSKLQLFVIFSKYFYLYIFFKLAVVNHDF